MADKFSEYMMKFK